jgi:hypothetical protein
MKRVCAECERTDYRQSRCLTTRGKTMPVDAEPDPDGLLTLDTLASGVVLAAHDSPGQPGLFTQDRYTSHFATCPEAARWRRG